jgi:hypothetical protein
MTARRFNAALVLLLLFSGIACLCLPQPSIPTPTPNPYSLAPEQPMNEILLGGVIFYKQVATSGLAWYGDLLLDLPQRVDQYSSEENDIVRGGIFAIRKVDILNYLGGDPKPVGGHPFVVNAPGLLAKIPDYQGFEAIAVSGEQIYLAIEAGQGSDMQGYLVTGVIDPLAEQITLDITRLVSLPPQAQVEGMAYEALTIVDDKVLAIYAANGAGLNLSPVAYVFSLELDPLGTIPFPNVEYRITDATPADEQGRFWVLNCYNPANAGLLPRDDPLFEKYGQGATHAQYPQVERLVQLQYTAAGIILVDEPPTQLQLAQESRNWEGIARLDDQGFLLITDQSPYTMLAFVSKP